MIRILFESYAIDQNRSLKVSIDPKRQKINQAHITICAIVSSYQAYISPELTFR